MDSLPPTYTYVLLGVLGLLTAVYFFSYKRVYGTANTPPLVRGKAGTREIPASASSSSSTSAKKKKKQPQKQQVVQQRKIVEEAGQETGEEAQVLDARVTSFNPYASLEQAAKAATNNQHQKQQKVKEVAESPVAPPTPPATTAGAAAGGGKNKKKNKKVKSAQESPQLPHSVTAAAATETIKTFQQHVETETIQPDRQILTQVDVTEVVDRDSSTRQLVMQESQIIATSTGGNGAEVGKKSKKKKKVAKVETPPPPPPALTESEPELTEAVVQITTTTTTMKESDITTMEIAEEEMTPVGGSRRRRRRGKKGGAGDFKDEDEQQQQLYEPSPTVDIVERSTHTTETTTVTHGVPVMAAVKDSPELRSELAKLQEQTLAYENRVKQLEMMNIVMEKENSRLQQQYSQALQAKTEEEVLRLQLERKVRNFEEQEEQLKYTNRVLFEQLSEAKDRERERLRQMETKGVTLSVS